MADHALLIGINNYASIGDLNGCRNDVANIRKLLQEQFSFAAANITVLEDDRAVKRDIERIWKRLARAAKAGDRLVFHFSGHGTAIRSRDDDEEQDGKDELICLYDMTFGNPGTYLTDDELAAMTRDVASGVHLTFILDNCHSGTGTREVFIAESALKFGAAHPVLPRYVEPPQEWKPKRDAGRSTGGNRIVEAVRKAAAEKDLNHLLLAGAMETQTAADAFIAGAYNGAFTYYLCDNARAMGGRGSALEIFKSAQAKIAAAGYTQIPQCEGPDEFKRAPLFGKDAIGVTPSSQKSDVAKPSPSVVTALLQASGAGADQRGGLDAAALRELIAVQARFLDIVAGATGLARSSRPQIASSTPDRARAPSGDIVYVHGIGPKQPGYATAWFDALSQHLGSGYRPVEVFWSDIVNSRDAGVDEAKVQRIRAQLEAVQLERAAAAMREAGRDIERELTTRGARGPLDLLFSLDDFPRYLASSKIRDAVIDRFIKAVEVRLAAGHEIDVVSHSWGTVVAYEGLVRLEKRGLPGRVRNFFTVGSALAWAFIRTQLEDAARDGHRPAMVDAWININAVGDFVGGSLGNFAVTDEHLAEPAVGCGFPSSPTCPHSSYFRAENLSVNRDLFAGRILA